MPSYKLTYFDMKGGRGDSIRMAFHYAGIPFEDERLTREEFGAIKDSLPSGQLPILSIDDKKVISQEVQSYVTLVAWQASIQMIEKKLSVSISRCVLLTHPGKEIVTKMVIEERIPKMLRHLDKYLDQKQTTFSAGNKLTVADLRIYSALTFYESGILQVLPTDILDKYPHIVKLHQAIEGDEKISSWIKMGQEL
ncbi:hypothetical protein KEM48_008189 [Puccinia striiformis f. sp. tritici PST-130]|nr:hypothetical protein KEM48_008189 [Puccinia striiformis f. sp. tritici PST-130]